MAKKKSEIALQKEILNEEAWEKELEHNGILVIDVYQNWCGPCKATVAMFRRIKNELGDDLLGFAVAEADSISALSFYRGKCIPTFLFYAGKKLQTVVRGCNAPLIERTIQEQLAREHKVQAGEIERMEFIDPLLEAQMKAEEEARLEALKPKPVPKECTVMVIKPDAVEAGHVDEILEKVRENGFEIVQAEERLLSETDVRTMYEKHQEEPWFEDLVELMTRGPCHVVLMTKGDTGAESVLDLRKLVGPTDANQAKEEEPETLRALYGTDNLVNGVHAADSKDQAAQELGFFFPDADLPMQELVEPGQIQRTLAIIRPDAYRERGEEILAQIKASGFQIALKKEMMLSREQAAEFYKEHQDEPFFEMLIENMTSGPVLALGLARKDAVSRWRDMLGPKEKEKAIEEAPESLRAQFSVETAPINQIHGSDSIETAEKELEFFFPKEKTLAIIKPNAMQKKDEIMKRISEAGFQVSAQKESHLTREMAEEFYKEHIDKEFFDQLVDFMSSGDTLFLILTREDAVNSFRQMCGDKDPLKAKEDDPDSIRALFGDDILKNGIHSSSSVQHAFEKISKIFGDEAAKAAEEAATEEQEAPAEGGEGGDQPTEESGEGAAGEEGAGGETEGGGDSGETEQAPAEGEGGAAEEEGGETGEGTAEGDGGDAAPETGGEPGESGEAAGESGESGEAAGESGESGEAGAAAVSGEGAGESGGEGGGESGGDTAAPKSPAGEAGEGEDAAPAAEGGAPAAEGGAPAAEGGAPAAEGGAPAADGGAPEGEGGGDAEKPAEGGGAAPETTEQTAAS